MPTIAQSDITVSPIVTVTAAALIVAAVLAGVAIVAAALKTATTWTARITWAHIWAAVIDYLRPSPGVKTPTAKAIQPRRPGAHRAAGRATRKRVTA